MIPDIEPLIVVICVFIIDESHFIHFFRVNNVGQQQIVMAEHRWTVQLLQNVTQSPKVVFQFLNRWKEFLHSKIRLENCFFYKLIGILN